MLFNDTRIVCYIIVFPISISSGEQELLTGWMERLRQTKTNKNEDVRGMRNSIMLCHGEDRSICTVEGGPIKSKQLENYQNKSRW